jgi:hypothetical protein
MAKIQLTIDKNYCSDWGVWDGVRELIQNAKDADDDGYKMTVEHFPRTSRLEITSAKTYVEPAKLLVLGKSDKAPGTKRGQFGEGFVLGCLALMRKGCDVSFRNGDLSWSISFEEPDVGHPLAGNELMTFKSRTLAHREQDFRIEIENIDAAVWDILKKLFLFITPPTMADTLATAEGSLLLHAEYIGQVFSRGIFVRKFENLSCGYDMTNLALDRDRRFVDEWDLHYKLGKIWKDACHASPALASPKMYEMAKSGNAEAAHFKWHADDKLLKDVRERFEQEHGEGAVPVGTVAQSKEIEEVGGKPTMVNDVLKELLEKGGLSVATAKKTLEGQIDARFTPYDLTGEEQIAFARLHAYVPEFIVVTFKGKAVCRLIDDDKKIGFDRRLLAEPFNKTLKSLVSAEAKLRSVEPVDILIEHATKVFPADPVFCERCGFDVESITHKDTCSQYLQPDGPKAELTVGAFLPPMR